MAILKDLVVQGQTRLVDDTVAEKVTADEFVKSGGTSSQFLKADGSVDSNTYATTSQIPSVSNATITVTQTGKSNQTFTLNGSATTIALNDTNTWRPVSDSVSSTDSSTAASSKAVKTAYDLANTANEGLCWESSVGVGSVKTKNCIGWEAGGSTFPPINITGAANATTYQIVEFAEMFGNYFSVGDLISVDSGTTYSKIVSISATSFVTESTLSTTAISNRRVYRAADLVSGIAYGKQSTCEGWETETGGTRTSGKGTAAGVFPMVAGHTAHAEGYGCVARGSASHAEGYNTFVYGDGASGCCASHVEGYSNSVWGSSNHGEGQDTVIGSSSKTGNNACHVEGSDCSISGDSCTGAHVEGDSCSITADFNDGAHVEGYTSKITGESNTASHVEGYYTLLSSSNVEGSHVEGYHSKIDIPLPSSGVHVEGYYTEIQAAMMSPNGAHVEGYNTKGNGHHGSHTEGTYNYVISANESEKLAMHVVGIGDGNSSRKNAHVILKNGEHYIYGIGGYDGTTIDGAKSLQQCIGKMQEITWSALKSLRDSSGLTPGMQYRITDYNTTTTQTNTQAAGHQFDIIVVADSVNKLNENARAVLHNGDTYFSTSGANLNAWEIKYSLDNDTTRFAWAVTGSTGRGVIYYMKDEWNNECPYDFKNIQFPRYEITACPNSPDLVGQYSIDGANGITVDTATTYWCYTFTWINEDDEIEDLSIIGQRLQNDESQYNGVFDNKIESHSFYDFLGTPLSFSFDLSNNCFISTYGFEDGLFYGCYSNRLGSDCADNTFGNDFYSNTFGNNCYSNTFGNACYNNIFGNDCYSNTFGNDCMNNIFRNHCNRNIFGNNCYSNTFGNGCSFNIFGIDCHSNAFKNGCTHNTFGNNCYSNTFGNSCSYITILKNYVNYIIVENGNEHIDITSTQTTSASNKLQNITIAQGVHNSTTTKTISHNTLNDTFKTTYQSTNSLVINV